MEKSLVLFNRNGFNLRLTMYVVKKFGIELLPIISCGLFEHPYMEAKRTFHLTFSWIFWAFSIESDIKLKRND